MNRNNLERLATYLESLPEDYSHFHMGDYLRGNVVSSVSARIRRNNEMLNYARNNGGFLHCAYAACAVGHGPAAGILVPQRYLLNDSTVNWLSYNLALFTEESSANGWPPIHEFLFSSVWMTIDNHHWGAAARIRYALADEVIPENDFEPSIYAAYDKRRQ